MADPRDGAKIIALEALRWLLDDNDLLGVFMGSTGASVSDLRERVEESEFLGFVLAFILQDDTWVISFCEARRLSATEVLRAHAALAGDQPDWE